MASVPNSSSSDVVLPGDEYEQLRGDLLERIERKRMLEETKAGDTPRDLDEYRAMETAIESVLNRMDAIVAEGIDQHGYEAVYRALIRQ